MDLKLLLVLLLLPNFISMTPGALAQQCLIGTPEIRDRMTPSFFPARNRTYVVEDFEFTCNGKVTDWISYIATSDDTTPTTQYDIIFSVWREGMTVTEPPEQCFSLVGSNFYMGVQHDANQLFQVSVDPAEQIQVEPGDLAGFYIVPGHVQMESRFSFTRVFRYERDLSELAGGECIEPEDRSFPFIGIPIFSATVASASVEEPQPQPTQTQTSTQTQTQTTETETESTTTTQTETRGRQPTTIPSSSNIQRPQSPPPSSESSTSQTSTTPSATLSAPTQTPTTTDDTLSAPTQTPTTTDDTSSEEDGAISKVLILALFIVGVVLTAIVGLFCSVCVCICCRFSKRKRAKVPKRPSNDYIDYSDMNTPPHQPARTRPARRDTTPQIVIQHNSPGTSTAVAVTNTTANGEAETSFIARLANANNIHKSDSDIAGNLNERSSVYDYYENEEESFFFTRRNIAYASPTETGNIITNSMMTDGFRISPAISVNSSCVDLSETESCMSSITNAVTTSRTDIRDVPTTSDNPAYGLSLYPNQAYAGLNASRDVDTMQANTAYGSRDILHGSPSPNHSAGNSAEQQSIQHRSTRPTPRTHLPSYTEPHTYY